MLKRWLIYSAVTVLAASCLFAQTPARVQTFPLRDTTGLIAPKVKTEAVKYLGRKSVRITMEGDDREGLALLPGTDFQDGVIEADIALKDHDAAGCQVSRLCRDCLPRPARCIALRVVLPEAGKLRGRGSGDAQPCRPIRLRAGLRMVSPAPRMARRFMSLMRNWRWRLGQKCASRWPAAPRNSI